MHSITIPTGTPTQVAHQARTMLRTALQATVGALVGWLATKGFDLTEYTDAIVGISSVIGGGILSYIMAQPAVNRFIDKWLPFLGTGVEQETGKVQPLGDEPLSAPAGEGVVVVPDIDEEA